MFNYKSIIIKPNYPVTISGTGEDLFGAGPNNTPSFKRIFARAGQGLSVNTYFNLSDPSSPSTGHIEIAYEGDQSLPTNLYVANTVFTNYLQPNTGGTITSIGNLTINGGLTVNNGGRNPFFFVCGKIDGFTGTILSDYGKYAYTSVRTAVGVYVISFTASHQVGANYSVVGSSPGQHVAITAQATNSFTITNYNTQHTTPADTTSIYFQVPL